MCEEIISKTTLSKEEKIDLYTTIKKIDWDFKESIADDIPVSIRDSLQQLLIMSSESSINKEE